eukprot:830748-Prymnesium_polylepis.1
MGVASAMQWMQERWDRAVGSVQEPDVSSPQLPPPLRVVTSSAGTVAIARVHIVDGTGTAAEDVRATSAAAAAARVGVAPTASTAASCVRTAAEA